eukprot:CAMPEP_0194151056 /NCGR_PEP_ID=MMETSP0152-20130528/46366_1 /TAXON_ID=1049557 /ORGANISM="Thalassiothrix antarctica, Strain L6-D1" /LENGTH=402 /DNA_ID=CAMNT_0038854513 /DNA_START=386 /DNA_END=1594 /DNA_ORIENTATION=-
MATAKTTATGSISNSIVVPTIRNQQQQEEEIKTQKLSAGEIFYQYHKLMGLETVSSNSEKGRESQQEEESRHRRRKHVILSVAVHYSFDTIQSFVENLRYYYDGPIILLIDPNNNNNNDEKEGYFLHQYFIDKSIQTVTMKEDFSSSTEYVSDSEEWHRLNTLRFQFYQHACNSKLYDDCFAIDFRDVIFQANPFLNNPYVDEQVEKEETSSSWLHTYEHNIIMNQWHYEQLHRCQQYDTYHKFLDFKPILNAGGIYATPDIFQRLWSYMDPATSTTSISLKGCNDQIVYNIAVYANLLLQNTTTTKIYIHPQGYGMMNNVGYGGEFLHVTDDNNDEIMRSHSNNNKMIIRNKDCFVSPIVHQMDQPIAKNVPLSCNNDNNEEDTTNNDGNSNTMIYKITLE